MCDEWGWGVVAPREFKEFGMTKIMRSMVVLAAFSVAGSMGFAQSAGEAVYKANCQSCHGTSGTPSPGIAKMMGVKAVSDPDIKKLTAEQEFDSVKNGKGKMKPFASKLTDAQIKDAVTYFRSLK
jgi:mono/diheme cytochrome c family protein